MTLLSRRRRRGGGQEDRYLGVQSSPAQAGVLIQWNGGMEWNGMSAATFLHVLQPTRNLILRSHPKM